MRKDDLVRLRHMADAARDAISFAQGKERHDLDADRMLALSLVKCIEIIGEAACHVSDECRKECSRIPWSDIVGMRHRLIHAYYDVNLEVVWRTVKDDLPPLLAELDKLVPPKSGRQT